MGMHYSISIDDGKNEFIINNLDNDLRDEIVECLNLKYIDEDDVWGYEPIKLTKSKANILVDKLKTILVEVENNSYLIKNIDKRIIEWNQSYELEKNKFKSYTKKHGRINAYIKHFKENRAKPVLRILKKEKRKLKLAGGWSDEYKKVSMGTSTKSLITELERLTKNNSFSKSKISLEIDGGQGHYRWTRKEAKDRWAQMKKENPKEYEKYMNYYKRIAKKNKTKFKPL